ncbi:K+-transporting ATPase, A subunit [Corynebacterium simulans]|uniref:potassium-transporting ATPase subunit KdpA n=1 Tax=Corynebacterium simulans TaxID=146827 RepID=UPI0007828AA7|nr:potassium-transporting ATPase subunit KdpA [Corynebacterium simulans]AMO90913.1 K+-transporting ATPase, A subunit [Corynebacterium simulans]
MTGVIGGYIPFVAVFTLLAVLYVPLGGYMAKVFTGANDLKIEKAIYKVLGVDSSARQTWRRYAGSLLAFSMFSIIVLYLLQRLQQYLPWAHGMRPVDPDQAWNTAVSFTTNTNWQSYSGETAMSQLTQMLGMTVQNFVSGAVGISVAAALIRGFAARNGDGRIGNFWVDLTRVCLRILLPMATLGALFLMTQGVIQNLQPPVTFTTVTGATQTIPGGAVASQEVIKELGTNGGGYFNANSAHPFENPTVWSNALEIFLILVIPVSLTRTFGLMVRDTRQGYAILSAMAVLYFLSLASVTALEATASGAIGGGMEGREMRLGTIPSALFAVTTTMTSTGAVDSFHSSYTPLGGGLLILNMLLGEVSPGGVGTGLYGMLVMAILSVFIAGLIVGRTPEYLGKRIGVGEMIKVCLYVLVMPTLVLGGVALSVLLPSTPDSLSAAGPHGFSDLVYAFTSASNNNGSAFAGFGADTWWFNISLGMCMLLGRFLPIVMVLAIAGAMAKQRIIPTTSGTLPTHSGLFVGLLIGVVLIVGALTFLPTLVLGPILEATL